MRVFTVRPFKPVKNPKKNQQCNFFSAAGLLWKASLIRFNFIKSFRSLRAGAAV